MKYLNALWNGIISGITVALIVLLVIGMIGMLDGPHTDISLRHLGPVAGFVGLVCGAIISAMNLFLARKRETDFIRITPIFVIDMFLGG